MRRIRPPDHERPDLPSETATREECQDWNKNHEKWLDEVYYPGEPDRVLWETAHKLVSQYEFEKRAAHLVFLYNLKRYGLWIGIGIGGLLAASGGIYAITRMIGG